MTGITAIVAGGLVAASIAHEPSRELVWMAAYLVLVAGCTACAFGLGQAMLAASVPDRRWVIAEWWLFNLGNAGVIVGTLIGLYMLVTGATVLFLLALVMFGNGVRGAERSLLWYGYHALIVFVGAGSLIGAVLSVLSD